MKDEENLDFHTPVIIKTKLLLPILVVLCILLIGGMTLYTFITKQRRTEQKKEDVVVNLDDKIEEERNKEEEKIDQGIVENKNFYIKDNNIFSYDILTKQVDQWTSYSSEDKYELKTLKIIDGYTLGFIRGYGFDDTLNTINLKTKEITKRKKFATGEEFSGVIGFATATKFAYTYQTDENKWFLSLYDDGSVKDLEETTVLVAYGRGGVVEDSYEIIFSPDQKYLLYISTSNPAGGDEDFNIYVYNLEEGKKDIIKNATQPQWLDNDLIVYRKFIYDDENHIRRKGDGLYVYNTKTGTSEKIRGVADSARTPNVLHGTKKIVYRVNPDFDPDVWLRPDLEIWLLDYESGENRKILDSAAFPTWLNENNIAFTILEECDDCMYGTDFSEGAFFDLNTNTITPIPEL